jgi:hypothetical protein
MSSVVAAGFHLSIRAASAIESEDALQVSKEHLDLVSLTARNGVGLGLGDRARLVAGGFVKWSGRSCARACWGSILA